MKHLCITVLLTICFVSARAQNVYIPNYSFKYQLLNDPNINTNGDNEIQESEALTVTSLDIRCIVNDQSGDYEFIAPDDITGIQSFTNLHRLTIPACRDGGGIHNINLQGLANLKYLLIDNDTALKKLNLNGCTALDTLIIYSDLYYSCALDTLDLRSCVNLKYLNCLLLHNLRTLLVQECANLKKIILAETLSALDLSGLMNLEEIEYQSGGNLILDIHGSSHIRKVTLTNLSSINLNLGGCTNLENLTLNYVINFYQNNIDLSSASNLKNLYISGFNSQDSLGLKELNIKNGSILDQVYISPGLNFICADDFEIDTLRHLLSGFPGVSINSYCSFFPGGTYNTISGNIKLSEFNGGCSAAGRNLQGVAVKFKDSTTNQSVIEYSNLSGNYHTYTNKGNFVVSPNFPYPYFTVDPFSSRVIFDTANNLVDNADFCIHGDGIHNDLEVTFLPVRRTRPGFDAYYDLVYKNKGTTTLSGVVQLNFDNSKVNFISTTEPATTQSTGQLSWNYNNLQPFETKTIHVTFNVLPPPVNNINDTISYLATITPTANDETAFDNNFILPVRLSGSLDPNEKQCLEGSKIDISKIGDYLHYQIHFQNEGTDTAFNIVVADTLSEKLDWSSFEFIGSSHSCNAKLTNNKAEFFFPNINLPYKAINEPASNGYVAFKIKPKPVLIIGDSLNNTAVIYFDFNMPVITNKATTIVTNASTPVPVKVEYFSISSRNNINTLNWKAACTNGSAKFNIERSDDGIHFISIGNITATAIRCQLPFNFIDNNPVEGKNYYRLKITDADGISFYSKILIIGNGKAGLFITSVENNIVCLNNNKQRTIQLKVITADGKSIYADSRILAAGNSRISLPLRNSAEGIYTLLIYTSDGEIINRIFFK